MVRGCRDRLEFFRSFGWIWRCLGGGGRGDVETQVVGVESNLQSGKFNF